MSLDNALLGIACALAVLGGLLIARGLLRAAATGDEFFPLKRKKDLHAAMVISLAGCGLQALALGLGATGVMSLRANHQQLQNEVGRLSNRLVSLVQNDLAKSEKTQPVAAGKTASADAVVVSEKPASQAAGARAVIATSGSNAVMLRETPGGAVIGKLRSGDPLELLGEQSTDSQNWAQVRSDGKNGWVARQFVKTNAEKVQAGTEVQAILADRRV